MKVHSIYDNGGSTADRFTVFYGGRGTVRFDHRGARVRLCVGMSADPFNPQGFGQHGEGMPGRHIGRRIAWADLPSDCKRLVEADLAG
jgi:hypothetical protein